MSAERTAPVCTCVEDVVCGACMSGAVTPGVPADADEDVHKCPPEHRHGEDANCYTNHRCRCDGCRTYAREHRYWLFHLHRAGKLSPGAALDARGVRRRLEALMAIGWSMPAVAERVGVHRSLALRWLEADAVEASTITRVSAVYEQLRAEQPPADTHIQRGIANRTRRLAAERGYVDPAWWVYIDTDDDPTADDDAEIIDVVAIELAVGGARVALTTHERHEAVRQLNARGYYDTVIARMLSVDQKTIARDRELLDLPTITPTIHADRATQKALAA
ncbi:hypothetical protein AB1K56_08140 [Microbacterium sp. BWR-S6Y]|uniref:hypothetical protein n=1 Tax=Microbacterium sp. BWR-S6Y TaxID=3232073 RepID=UPI00352832EC